MQKLFIIALAVATTLFAAGGKLPPNVPTGAAEIAPGVYRFVDKNKKAWIYRPSPFGYSKSEESADRTEARETPAPRPEGTTATPFGESKDPGAAPKTKAFDAGDSVRFEQPTPFGVTRWTRKKTELSDDERRIWDGQRTSGGAQSTPAK